MKWRERNSAKQKAPSSVRAWPTAHDDDLKEGRKAGDFGARASRARVSTFFVRPNLVRAGLFASNTTAKRRQAAALQNEIEKILRVETAA
jgi:hypothetical protein